MAVRSSLAAFWRRVGVVPLLLVRGERALRRGRLRAAERHFRAAVRQAPTCFRAHFGLARVLAAGRHDEAARRELVIARHLAPSRFRELRRVLPPPLRDEEPVAPATLRGDVLLSVDAASVAPRDDCVDDAERARFRSMGPIHADELGDADWDRLAAELGRRGD